MMKTNDTVDRERFLWAAQTALAAQTAQEQANEDGSSPGFGIGTLNEGPLHACIKLYMEPRTEFHETTVSGYISDIVNGSGITEIQTRGFSRLARKLPALLESAPVNVVYPVAEQKWLIWVDKDTGEASAPRKSPKRDTPFSIFYELTWMKDALRLEGLSFTVLCLGIEEYRYLDGYDDTRKKRSTRARCVPVDIYSQITFDSGRGLAALLPDGLPEEFTVKELTASAHTTPKCAQRAIYVLKKAGAIESCGKRGRALLYRRTCESRADAQ